MTAALPFASELVAPVAPAPVHVGPTLAEIKARAKSIKKHCKHERRRFFHGFCQCLHAIGFSF